MHHQKQMHVLVMLMNLRRRQFATIIVINVFVIFSRSIIYWMQNIMFLNLYSTKANIRAIASFS